MKKVKSKYLALGLLFGFISCDLFIRYEMKEESPGLFDKGNSILETSEESIKKPMNKKGKGKIARKKGKSKVSRKEPYIHSLKRDSANKSNFLQKNVILEEESLKTELLKEQSETRKEKIQKQQDEYKGMTQGSLNYLSGESGELEEPIESNEIDLTIDSDLRPKSSLQGIAGSNSISYTDEIEEEDYDRYYLDEYDEEEIRLSNRYQSYLEGVKYNVDSAIQTITKIYNTYILFSTKLTQMYSTRLDNFAKAKAKEEAAKFTKEDLEKNFKTLLNYIQVSVKTAANFVYINDTHAKRKLENIEAEIKTLITKIKEQSNLYGAYKAIVTSILLMRDSLKEVQGIIDKNGVWY
ncbi:fibronectin-binding protein [Borreliella burgdorferi]|uniref:Putative fibronectin-binding protein n=1 Tax=Borreliella burgdorferi (strain ZS7) TaxID=445985 RepID=A0A0H3C1E0_BORBZ|nr:fibronectin-binding protein [Borreliella burgdorferi]ACK74299.1 putative fibronectin-binding protein [Borreliella burgdorferi ZS7]ACO37859.1 immunogenic protein P35 [Borreliella burgdorferi Bol26]MCS2181961.1 fibronectin-binding protein [Borreliella burgdorferi]MCS2181990.1 fibronectin-binding protein [Borreliella burgdorferi]PRQ98814.1 ferrous iron transporter A [Borreliella burgdorferi]